MTFPQDILNLKDAVRGKQIYRFIIKWADDGDYAEMYRDLRYLIDGCRNGAKEGINHFSPPTHDARP